MTNQLAKLWSSLSRVQQLSLVLVPVVVLSSIFGVFKWEHNSSFRVLYSGLAPEDASAATQKVREAGIEFRLDETGSTVSVPATRIAEARLALAGAGLPRSGRIGFELFDRSNLGASDFAEQVNYRRALEGELERSVATLSEIEQARIHITFAKESVFLDARQPSKATVVLRLKRSAQLAQPSVVAIANLVASAVDGLSPEAVAIVDSNGRLLNRPHPAGDSEAQLAEANLDYRHQVESEMVTKINLALGPLLGPDRFRASVSADCDFTTSEENEETVDPGKAAILTSQTTEEASGAALAGGTPGTASNLPRPTARATTTGTGLMRRTENVSYQPSRTVRHTVTPKGSVKRVFTAVLVDQTVRWEGTGTKVHRVLVPPTPEVLKGVHDIVAGITGFTEQRGDQITVETLPFESTLESQPPEARQAPAKPVAQKLNYRSPVIIGAAAGVLLLLAALGFLVFRRKPKVAVANTSPAAIAGSGTAPTGIAARNNELENQLAENAAQQSQIEAEMLSHIKLPASTRKSEALVRNIRDSVQKDPVAFTNVLRSWIADPDRRTR